MYEYLCGLYEKYLYDPNSPLLNEELFIVVLESQIDSDILQDYEKIRPRELHKMPLKTASERKPPTSPIRSLRERRARFTASVRR